MCFCILREISVQEFKYKMLHGYPEDHKTLERGVPVCSSDSGQLRAVQPVLLARARHDRQVRDGLSCPYSRARNSA